MYVKTIPVSKIEPYFKFIELKSQLALRLHLYNKYQELQLKQLKEISRLCVILRAEKQKHKFRLEKETDEDIIRALKRY